MNTVPLLLPENEARELYRRLHQWAKGQDLCYETYRQLQAHFFMTLTVQEVMHLLEDDS